MNQAEQQIFLDKCESAFLLFVGRNPHYEQTESNARHVAAELRALGLSPTSAEHLQLVWDKLKVPAVAPSEPADPIEIEARRLIASGEVTAQGIADMSSEEFLRRSHNLGFVKACELLEPPAPAGPALTRGDIALQAGIAERARLNGIVIEPYDPAAEVARSNREFQSGFANHQEPTPQPEGGVPNSGPDFSRGRYTKQPGRRQMTAAEARANEVANGAGIPRKSRGEIVRENQLREAEAKRALQAQRDR
jgi:hypothetical protein